MVGVAGKSKACNTCRARKVKCDEQRPECGQCLKNGRSCPGYRRNTLFVDQNVTAATRPVPSASKSAASLESYSAPTTERGSKKSTKTAPKHKGSSHPQLIAWVNDQYIYQDFFAGEFLRIYLPSSNNCPKAPLTWLQLVFSVPREGLVLDRAMAAVTLSVVGRATNNTDLAIESSRKYGQALWELQRALWDDRLMYRDETLAACNALVLYELLESTGNSLMGWISHAQGVARLIEARGPDTFDSPLAHMMFKTFRHTTMIQDLQGRMASIFTSPKWQSGPWKKHRKGPDQTLYDIGADLANLLADADRCKSMQDSSAFASERIALVKNCASLEGKLEAWFQQLLEDIPAPHYWAEFSNIQNPLDDAEDHKLFPVSYRFANIFIARILMDFWAISILLHSTTLFVYRSLTGGTNPRWPEHRADDKRTPAKPLLSQKRLMPPPQAVRQPSLISSLADNIAQSMEYCLAKEMGTLGPQWALFGLRVAMQTYLYTPDAKKHQWLHAIHDKIADEKGVRFSKTIAAYTWETARLNPNEVWDLQDGLHRLRESTRASGTSV